MIRLLYLSTRLSLRRVAATVGMIVVFVAVAATCRTHPEAEPLQPPVPGERPLDREVDERLEDEPEPAVEVTEREPVARKAPEPEEEPPEPEYTVSEKLYAETFEEVEEVIAHLNEIIAERDYDAWRGLLTDEFVAVHSDPDTLRRRSESPILRRRSIVLESLQDYFEAVVVPSRAEARLDGLRFLDDDRVEALMAVGDQKILLYQLRRDATTWKIDYY